MENKSAKISLEEMSEDIGAFLHFLKNHSILADHHSKGVKSDSELCSTWMLIPFQLDVEFREGVNDCLLEKEVYSRKILIISEPVDEDERSQRRRELLKYFSRILDGDQADQVINLLQNLDEQSRLQIRKDFREYQKSFKKNKGKDQKYENSSNNKI